MRKPFVAGNWKMNLSLREATDLAGSLRTALADLDAVELAVFPPFVFLPSVIEALKGSNLAVGAQNMHSEESGAFTGEVAASMLLDVGCSRVIIGHSERRHIFGESNEQTNAKLHAALRFGLEPILCVGEKLDERDAGKTTEVVSGQLEAGLEGITPEQVRHVTIAYEPVWAIGTGRNATPEQAQEVHATLRALLAERFRHDLAQTVRIQYGGSVKPDNADELMAAPDIDGALVGGASLKAESFKAIARAAAP